MNLILLVAFVAALAAADKSFRKSDGVSQDGVDASVKTVVWVVLALIALAYLTGWA
jgi:hypothetical protein